MRRGDNWKIGELEDVRPCDGCGEDYVFLVGEDPGKCGRCLRFDREISEAGRAARRSHRLVVSLRDGVQQRRRG